MTTKTRFIEARFYDGPTLVRRDVVLMPPPPSYVLARPAKFLNPFLVTEPNREPPTCPTDIYEREGVEVDRTGTWVRYTKR